MTIPLPPDVVAHHIFYNKAQTKAYVTLMGRSALFKFDLDKFPYRLETIDVPGCAVLEDIVFTEDDKTWYVTCMGTDNIAVGDAATAMLSPWSTFRRNIPTAWRCTAASTAIW
jgi:DNA-binding beta-propeller fold protein YncE